MNVCEFKSIYICSPLAQFGKAQVAIFTSLHLVDSKISFSSASTSILTVVIWFQSLTQYTPLISVLKYDCNGLASYPDLRGSCRLLVYSKPSVRQKRLSIWTLFETLLLTSRVRLSSLVSAWLYSSSLPVPLSCLKIYPPSKAHPSTRSTRSTPELTYRLILSSIMPDFQQRHHIKQTKTAGAVVSPDVMAHRRQKQRIWFGTGLS